MKVLHVITGLQKAAGTSVFCGEIANGFVASGHDVTLAVCNHECNDRYPLDHRVKLISIDSLFKTNGQRLTTNHYALIHIHALWTPILHKISIWARRNDIPIVWSTHGMTAPWSMRHKWWKKYPAWWLYQRIDLKHAAALHCTTEQELEWNKALGFKNCFVAPLGTKECSARRLRDSIGAVNAKRLLFVGRIYPVKGLMNLVRAWGIVVKGQVTNINSWKLRIVGPDQAGHLSCLKTEVRNLGIENCVEFAGPKFGDELSREYEDCECFILPSFTENFGGVVIDALAHAKPCIVSTFTPWKELSDRGCGWWVSNEPQKLAETILSMMELDETSRREMGERGRRLVEEKYTWDAVVKTMITGYEALIAMNKR